MLQPVTVHVRDCVHVCADLDGSEVFPELLGSGRAQQDGADPVVPQAPGCGEAEVKVTHR